MSRVEASVAAVLAFLFRVFASVSSLSQPHQLQGAPGVMSDAIQQMASETLNELIDAEVPHVLNASNAQIAQFNAQRRTSSQPRGAKSYWH